MPRAGIGVVFAICTSSLIGSYPSVTDVEVQLARTGTHSDFFRE